VTNQEGVNSLIVDVRRISERIPKKGLRKGGGNGETSN